MKTMDLTSPSHYFMAVLFGLSLVMASCSELGPDQEEVRTDLCYHGTVVGGECPSLLFVQVSNAKIGSKWSDGNKQFDNVVSINNHSDSIAFYSDSVLLTGNKQIYFKVKSVAQNGQECVQNNKPCHGITYYPSYPEISLCASFISNLNCQDDEK